jgi:hypothetical protein
MRQESEKKHAEISHGHGHSEHEHEGGCCGSLQMQKKHADLLDALDRELIMELEILRFDCVCI